MKHARKTSARRPRREPTLERTKTLLNAALRLWELKNFGSTLR